MLRPGLHFHNGSGITPADIDIIGRWSPLSLLEAMDGVVNGQVELLRDAWELAGRPPLVLRRYYEPRRGGPAYWGAHAMESVELAQRCAAAGIPLDKLMLKPFNEPNMPAWAQWEGFGDTEEDLERYNEALLLFMEIARREVPGITIGGPHVTVGNRDVRFPNDPGGVYYYHGEDGRFESSPCAAALRELDVHFVHCYGMHPGQYEERAHGLRFLEYEKYLQGKDIYVVEGAYGINSGQSPDQNTVRGQETVAYLRLLGEKYPQVKGIALWIGGDPGAGWFAFCHSNGFDPSSHRPVVYAVEAACQGEVAEPEPEAEPAPADADWDGLSEEMRSTVRVFPAAKPHEAHWRAIKVEVQPETDSMSLFGVLPAGSGAQVRFSWPGGEVLRAPQADPLAPPGARVWAASMPMFAPWGAYSAEVVGNSERVSGVGLYGSGLEMGYKGHHPVVVHFRRVQGEPAEPETEPEPPSPPLPDDPYNLMKAFPRAGLKDVVDLRDEIESFSDTVALEKLWRPFRQIRLVVVHHSGSDLETQTPLSIARYRVLEVGDPTIPYHFCIPRDGRLFFTARLCWRLPHSGKAVTNAESVSVCLLGHFGKQRPSNAQLEAVRRLVWWVLPEFLGGGWGTYRGLYVIPHGRLVNTECPGENLVDALIWDGGWSQSPFRREPAGEPVDGRGGGQGPGAPD
jgi:hypothetical protein